MGSTTLAPALAASMAFREVELPQQRVFDEVPFPLVVTPQRSTPGDLAEAVWTHKTWLEKRLHEAGAILFRGFAVPTASEFSDVIESFGYKEVPFMAGSAPRTHVVGRIYTSNDGGPSHATLPFHNEMAYVKVNPSKAFFYCDVEPASQGETPIVLGHIVYKRLKHKYPEFLQRLEEHGLIYSKVFPEETDGSSPIGRSWKSIFSTEDKKIAEQKAAKTGWDLEWKENEVRVKMGPVPGIKIDRTRPEERRIWFNSLVNAYTGWVDSRNELGKAVTLGDGTPLPPGLIEDCEAILEEECVAIPWRQGDVLMLDNWAVQHGRHPFTPPRRVLAAFTM